MSATIEDGVLLADDHVETWFEDRLDLSVSEYGINWSASVSYLRPVGVFLSRYVTTRTEKLPAELETVEFVHHTDVDGDEFLVRRVALTDVRVKEVKLKADESGIIEEFIIMEAKDYDYVTG